MGKCSKSKRTASKDWRGRQFLFVSLIVTALSIIFFFAAQLVYHKINGIGASPIKTLARSVAEFGGVLVTEVELKVEPEQTLDGEDLKTTQFYSELQRHADDFIGEPIFSADLDKMSSLLSEQTWIKNSKLRRQFPNKIQINIEAKIPVLVLRGKHGWVLADSSGQFVSSSRSLRGQWFSLPKVYGLEESLFGETKEMNRRLQQERRWLADLSDLLSQLKSQVMLSVDDVTVRPHEWKDAAIFKLSWSSKGRSYTGSFLSNDWKDRLGSLQFVLSDLLEKEFSEVKILGQYPERWFVSIEKEAS